MKLKQYVSKYGVRLAIVVLIVVLIALSVNNVLGGRAGLLKNADGALKAPVQKAATALLDWIEGIYGYLYEYDRLVEENNALRAENAELREANRDYSELKAENERLRTLFAWSEKHTDFVMESAKIVAWDASNYTSAFTIRKGSASGIALGDCVVTEYGALVGQVIELGSYTDLYLTKSTDGSLWLYTKEDFEALNREVNYGPLAVFNKKARLIDMMVISPAREVELDKTGRLSIPQILREFAGLEPKSECVILGSMSKVEIISAKKYEQMMIQYQDMLSDLGDELSTQRMGQ